MLKVMQLKASFATSIFRRFFFWSIGVYVVAIVVACVLTASPSGGIATIAGSLKYLVALTTILQIVTISFLLRWNMYVDSVTPSPWIHATLTGFPIGATVYYVIVERFSIARGDDIRETFCTISSLIICSIFTVFAYLVDNERKGSFKILLPDISPIISQNLQKLISSDLRHWFKTAVFIGIFLVCAENILSLLGTSFHLALDPNYSCKIDDNRTRCTSDQVGNYSTLSSVYFATIVSFMIRFVLEIAHTLLMQMLTFPLDFSKLAAQNIPNSLSKRASVGEDLISDALAIAGAQLNSERFSWHRNYLKGTGGSNGAALMHSLIGDRRVNELCQSHLLKSSSLGRGAVPVWQEPVEKQRLFAENLLAAVQPSLYCSPILPFFSSNTGVSRLDIICRSLALQDLKRSTLASNTRKKSVFEFSGKWPEIVFSCCAILDATSLQVPDRRTLNLLKYLFSNNFFVILFLNYLSSLPYFSIRPL